MNYWNEKVYKKKLQWNIWPFTEVISTLSRLSNNNQKLGDRVLEIGCGVGNNLIPIAKLGYAAFGIDISDHAIIEASQRALDHSVPVNLQSGNVENLPYESDFFSYVIDRSVLTCTTPKTITKAIAEILRVLKPGGVFMAFDWFGGNHPDLLFGTHIGDSCFNKFSSGRFTNVEYITSFDFNSLNFYLNKFTDLNISRVVSSSVANEILTETYNFTAQKPH
jgi:SAM-dependent methyltransferase